jgi:hypothetical protein
MADPSERRAHVRYPVNVPAMFRVRGGSVRATGIVENLSAGGGLLTNATGDLEVGESGVLRLMALSQSLRTTSRDTLELEAEVVHKAMDGFGLRFLGEAEYLVRLLDRTFGRSGLTGRD